MDTRSRALVLAAGTFLAAGVALLAWLMWSGTLDDGSETVASGLDAPRPQSPEADGTAPGGAAASPRAAIPIPRPSPAPTPDTDATEVDPAEPTPATDPDSDLVLVPADQAPDAIDDAIAPQIQRLLYCAQRWSAEGGNAFDGAFELHLEVNAGGLDIAEIHDVADVPPAVLDCLSDVLWNRVEWPPFEDATYDMPWTISVEDPDEDKEAEAP